MDPKPVNTLGYKIAIGVMAAVIGVMGWMLYNQKTQVITVTEEAKVQAAAVENLGDELDSLLAEHEKVKLSYDSLANRMQDKDSVIAVRAAEIKKLINSKAELSVVKAKLEELKAITSRYERQIDSLYVVNRQLKDENVKIKTDYNLEQQKTADLTKEKEDLSQKISGAAVFKAYKVTGTAFKVAGADKERETNKAGRTDKIKICFTVGENPLVTPGYQRFFVRIARPGDKQILTRGSSYTFQFLGQPLQFSCMETLNYDGTATDICTYYQPLPGNDDLPKGRYVVDIFTEDRLIGTGGFDLR